MSDKYMRSCILFICILATLLPIASCQGKKGMEYVGEYAVVMEVGESDDEYIAEVSGLQTLIGHLTLEDDQTYELLFVKRFAGKWEFQGDHILLIGAGEASDGRPGSDAMLRIVDSNTLQLVYEVTVTPELLVLFISRDDDE